MPISQRSTVELVLLILTTTLSATILITGVGIVIISLVHPEVNVSQAEAVLTTIMTALFSAVLGFIAGQSRRPPPSRSKEGNE